MAENTGLTGRWRLTETFDGYVNGGNFTWHPVAMADSHTLEFTDGGQYLQRNEINGGFQQCSGTYQLLPDNIIEINSSCQTVSVRNTISELTSQNLIINHSVREGVIRYKYVAEK